MRGCRRSHGPSNASAGGTCGPGQQGNEPDCARPRAVFYLCPDAHPGPRGPPVLMATTATAPSEELEARPTTGFSAFLSERSPWRLVTLSMLMLFVELALIRWTAANNVHLANITNFVLLASFLGIGVGFLLGGGARQPVPGGAGVARRPGGVCAGISRKARLPARSPRFRRDLRPLPVVAMGEPSDHLRVGRPGDGADWARPRRGRSPISSPSTRTASTSSAASSASPCSRASPLSDCRPSHGGRWSPCCSCSSSASASSGGSGSPSPPWW